MSVAITKEKIGEIGSYILEGLTEKEACILSDISPIEFTELKEKNEDVLKYIEKQITKFKHIHLKEIQTKKNATSSEWLLEKLRPEEFGSKLKQSNPTTVNIISAIIQDIQNGSQKSVLTPGNRGDIIREGEESNSADSTRLTISSVLK